MFDKIRIKFRSYNCSILDFSVKKVISLILSYDFKTIGPIPLPTKIVKYTVLRGPFVDKKSREQFEIRVHKRILDILNPDKRIVNAILKLNLPPDVEIEFNN